MNFAAAMHGRLEPDHYVATVLSALTLGPDCHAILDRLPVPLYTTDPHGFVTYSNPAAAEFAGRQPRIGEDRWCVTERLFSTTGEPIAHEACPMAEALKKREPLRERVAIAERPDGSRVAFRAYPTPIIDDDDELVGGMNLLIDVTDEQRAALAEQADRCRRLAGATYDRATASALAQMADGFSRTAEELRFSQCEEA
jgi:PAS domain S-box-containing protein